MSLIAGSSDEELAPSDDDQDDIPRGKSGNGSVPAARVQEEHAHIDSKAALKKMLKDPEQKKEVYEFADYLGMDVTEDQEFLWIAVEAMFAPLPRNWQEFENESGQIYYYNHSTKISQWEHPLDEYHKSLYRKQKDEKLKSSAPSRSVHAGKADKKWQEQDGKAAVMKSKHHQEVASEATSSAVVLQRPKSAARAGIRPSTRGGPAERAAAEEKERLHRQAEQEAERMRQKMQEEAEQRHQEALAAAEDLKRKAKAKPRTPPPVDEAAERERAALGDKISQLQERMRQRKEELAKQKESESQAAAAGPSLSELEKQKMEKMRQFIAQARDAKGIPPGQSAISSLSKPGMLSPLGGLAEGGGKKLLEPIGSVRPPPSLPPLR